ncbi:hypothetical protein KRX57_06910 [Weeksellaceae bacterium TAE3-ERU29]|nr:hypothetical protein [Weeksellaceae bacterium TAE3-ERU29]
MLGLIFLYFVGKQFYKLAEQFNKSKWGFAILGVVSYYGGTVLLGIIIGIMMEILSPGFMDTVNERLFGICMIPFGLLTCFLLYKWLQRKWRKEKQIIDNEIEEIGQ